MHNTPTVPCRGTKVGFASYTDANPPRDVRRTTMGEFARWLGRAFRPSENQWNRSPSPLLTGRFEGLEPPERFNEAAGRSKAKGRRGARPKSAHFLPAPPPVGAEKAKACSRLIARRGFERLERSPQALRRIPSGSLVMGRLGIE